MPSEPDPGTILIVDYDPGWRSQFEAEKRSILDAIGDIAVAVEHVGSTAVPGLASRPIIDIMVGLRADAGGEHTIEPMARAGYEYRGDAGTAGQYFFRKATDSPAPGQTFDGVGRTVHIHMYETGHPEWDAHIRFRDFLRKQPPAAARYAALKRELAAKHPRDRAAYGEGKTPFVSVVLGRSRGVEPKQITVADYDPDWPGRFEDERAAIERVLGDAVLDIQHIGSTAVPGLAAKPVIDMLIAVADLDEARRRVVEPLASLGYDYVPEYESVMPQRLYFRKGDPRGFHIHMVEPSGEFWDRHIRFRDFLREHPEAVAEYATLKKRLAREHGSDMDGYTDAKSDFIRGIEKKAREGLER
jgi:GrpB-like predicted nucleotidyltransferase (UPF0157 family)